MASEAKKSYAKKTAPELSPHLIFMGDFETALPPIITSEWSHAIVPLMRRYRYAYPAISYLPGANAIIVAGGQNSIFPLSSVETFDFSKMIWIEQPPMSIMRKRTAGICLADGITFLVCGGDDGDNLSSCEQFNSITRTWSPVADMLAPRMLHSMVLYKGIPIVLGGIYDGELNTCEQYESGKWSSFPAFDISRYEFGAAVVLDKIYIAGGYINSHTLSTVEFYDGASWSIMPTKIPPRARNAVVGLQDKLIVLGGTDNSMDTYDPIHHTWQVASYTLPYNFHFLTVGMF